MNKKSLFALTFIFLTMIWSISAVFAAERYKIADTGSLGTTSEARAINDAGQTAGTSLTSTTIYHGFIWDKSTGMRDLGTLAGSNTGATSLNNKRRVVGYSYLLGYPYYIYHAFLWIESTGIMDLGTLGGYTSVAWDINDAGYIVGESKNANNKTRAFVIFDYLQDMQEIGVLPGGSISGAQSINNNDYVTGYSLCDNDTATHGFIWHKDHGMTDITPSGWNNTYPISINDSNQIVGYSYTPSSASKKHAFVWDQTTGMRDLGTLGGDESLAYSINNHGVVVGSSNTAGSASDTVKAFIWSPDEGMRNLNDCIEPGSGWILKEACGINDSGQIAGWGYYNGISKAFVLTPMQYYTELEAVYLWDGKTTEFKWTNYYGKATLVRQTDGETINFPIEGANSFIDNTMTIGKKYTYYLADLNGNLLTNKVSISADVVVVLVRGYYYSNGTTPVYWWSSGQEETKGLIDTPLWLKNHGIICWDPNFDIDASQIYMSGQYSIEDNVEELYNYIQYKMLNSKQLPSKIYLIGHEMGGLIARRFVEKYQFEHFVPAIFTINTPNTGTPFTRTGSFILAYDASFDMIPEKMLFFNALNRPVDTKLYSIWSASFSKVSDPMELVYGANEIIADPMFFMPSGSQVSPNDGFSPSLSMQGIIRDYQGNNPVTSVVFDDQYQINLNRDSSHKNTVALEKITQWMGLDLSYYENENDTSTPIYPDNETYNIPQNKVANKRFYTNSSTPVSGSYKISASSEANFILHTSDPACTYTLRTPSGIYIDPAYALSHQNVDYDNEGALRIYTVRNPEVGSWTFYLVSTAPTSSYTEYVLSIFERNSLKMKAYTPSTWYNTGNPVTLYASIVDGTSPLNDATVTAVVYNPDNSYSEVTLYNDGAHNDGTNSDGIYAVEISPAQQGYYFVQVKASGLSFAGGNFERQAVVTFSNVAQKVVFNASPSDSGIDTDSDSRFDKIKFDIPVAVVTAGNYVLSANLYDSEDNLLAGLSSASVALAVTSNKVELEISTEKLVRKNVAGTLKLKNIEIYDASLEVKVTQRSDYQSSSYTLNQFDELDSDKDGLTDNFETQIGTSIYNTDTDNDGLSDFDEVNYDGNPAQYTAGYDTDPLNPDTDGDGFPDGWEVTFGFNPLVNEGLADSDTDNDGLTNMEEYYYSTNPLKSDTDNDQMPDKWELDNNMNPHINNKYSDTDNDFITDYEEFLLGTPLNNPDADNDGLLDGFEVYLYSSDPFNSDTDNDGLIDGIEADFKTNPIVADAHLDYDNDTLTNEFEITHGLSPVNKDSDMDGLADNVEINTGTSPLMFDTDHDGVYDKIEIARGTDPLNAQSYTANVFNPYGYDLNQDGYPDIVFSNYAKNSIFNTNSYIYWGSVSGFTISNKTELPTQGAFANIVFDINRDGYQDILFANYYNGSSYNINSYIYWGFAGGYSTSNRTELPGQGVYGAAIADFNKDGHYDIVFANYTNGTSAYINSYIYWGSDTGYSSTNRKELPTHYAHAVSAGDLNSDGWIDIVFCNLREQNTYFTYSSIYWGSENGFSVADTTDLETNRAFGSTLSDLNNDGYVDIVFSNMSSDSSYATNSYIYWGSYSGYNNYNRTMTPNNGATNNCVADINRDGYLDIIFSNYYNGSTYSLNSNIYWGTESYSYVLRSGLPTNGAYGGAVADLNKDGYMDFVFANGMEGANQNTNSYIYWGSPSGISIANRTLLPTCAARGVSAGNISAFTQNSIQSYLDTQFEVNRLRYGYEESYQGYIKLVSYTVAGKSIKRSRIYTPSGQWVSLTTDSAKKKAGLTEQGMVFSQAQAKWNNGEYYLKTYFTDGDILVKTFKKYSKQYPAWVDMIYPVHKCKTPVSFNIRWTGDITALEVYQLPENIKVAGVDSNLAGITSYNLAEGTLQTGKEYVAHVYRNSGPPYYSGSVTATQFKVETSDDWDCDGMPNNWETEDSLDPFNPFDALLDPDNDGLDNITEFQHQTSPQSSDTDLDAIPDGFEIQNGLNPLVSNENTDSDNDGLSDSLEYSINTLIFDPDTDSDGMSDGDEYYAGFDPKDSQSVFVVKSVNTQPAGAGFKLSWPASSASNAVYHIYYKESSSGIWVELQINQQDIITNPDGSKSYVDNSLQGFASGIKTRLYRVTITRQ